VLFLAAAVMAGAVPVITVSDATGREAAPVDLGADTIIEFPIALTEGAGPNTYLEYTLHRGSRDFPALGGAAYLYDYHQGEVAGGATLMREGLVFIHQGSTSARLRFRLRPDLYREGEEAFELRLVVLPFRVNPNVVLLDVRQIHGHGQTTNINIIRLTDNGSLGNGPFPVAVADLTGDGTPEIFVGSGGGVRSRYFIVDGTSAGWWRGQEAIVLAEFTPFADDTWAVYLAAADVNGDGFADVITGQGQGSPGRVTAWDIHAFRAGAFPIPRLYDTLPYSDGFTGGTRVAAADFTGDGRAEIVMGNGPGRFSYVLTVNANAPGGPQFLPGIFAYGFDFMGGVYPAAGDWNGDGTPEIITGAGDGGGPHVRIFNALTATPLDGYFQRLGSNGVRVAAPLHRYDGRSGILGFLPDDKSIWLRESSATTDELWNVTPGDSHIAACDPPREPAWPALPQLVKPTLTITLTGETPNRTKITFPSVPGLWYDLEGGGLQWWDYIRSSPGPGGELSFVNNLFSPHYYYRIRAVRVEE
jgi:FG-GAP-like repeat